MLLGFLWDQCAVFCIACGNGRTVSGRDAQLCIASSAGWKKGKRNKWEKDKQLVRDMRGREKERRKSVLISVCCCRCGRVQQKWKCEKSVLEKESRHRNLKNENEIAKDREDLISGVVEVCDKTVLTVCTAELGRTDWSYSCCLVDQHCSTIYFMSKLASSRFISSSSTFPTTPESAPETTSNSCRSLASSSSRSAKMESKIKWNEKITQSDDKLLYKTYHQQTAAVVCCCSSCECPTCTCPGAPLRRWPPTGQRGSCRWQIRCHLCLPPPGRRGPPSSMRNEKRQKILKHRRPLKPSWSSGPVW